MKIAVIGNAAGGKTKLSRRLSQMHGLSATHIDSIQFNADMQIRPLPDIRRELGLVTQADSWLIDGYGPLDLIEARFAMADRVVFLDWPIAQHYFWFLRRQLVSLWSPRRELPRGASELSWAHTLKVLRSMRRMHEQMRPELLRILARPALKPKVLHIQNQRQWRELYKNGITL